MDNLRQEAAPIDLGAMTPEKRAALILATKEYEKQEASRKLADKQAYQDLRDETVKAQFVKLQEASAALMEAKKSVFEGFAQLIDMKDGLFAAKTNRQSNTFTTLDGTISIKLGNRQNEGWDDTVDNGIAQVKDYMKTLAKDENSALLVDTIMGLIAKDRKGNLKASKVLELDRMAAATDDPDFKEGLRIIKAAYKPAPSCQFIEATYRGAGDKEISLPLSMSAISMADIATDGE